MRPQCGTLGGHAAHKRHSETACIPCADAKADYCRSRLIVTGKRRSVQVTARVLGLLLSGDPDALRQAVAELGQQTVNAARAVSVRADTKEVRREHRT